MTTPSVQIPQCVSLFEAYHTTKRERRFISGTVISTIARNAHGASYDVRTKFAQPYTLPIPLLMSHDWSMPCGIVTSLKAEGECLRFEAELMNNDRRSWSPADPWTLIASKEVCRVSFMPDIRNGKFSCSEVSVVHQGADAGAQIDRVWTRSPVFHIDRPREIEIWRSDRLVDEDFQKALRRGELLLQRQRDAETMRRLDELREGMRLTKPSSGEMRTHERTAAGYYVTKRDIDA